MRLPDLQPRLRLLFLLPFAPRLDATHGGARATAQLLTNLADRHQVALLYLRAAEEAPIDDSIAQRCALVEEVSRPSLVEPSRHVGIRRLSTVISLLRGSPLWVTDWAVANYGGRARALAQTWQPDIIQIEFHVMAQYLSALDACPAPRILTEHEPGARAARDLWRARQAEGRLVPYLNVWAWERFERSTIQQVQAVVVFTERDRQAIARFAGHTPIVRIPLGTMLPKQPLSPLGVEPPHLLFVGNFGHLPNVDAATRLISDIFPLVQEHYPELKLYIVGDRPPPQIRQMANEQVIITGRVPDVVPYLDRAALVVAPVRLGGGMRVKVLEALAAGKAMVASPLAVEGLDLADGEQIVLARSDQQFADAVAQLLADAPRRVALAARARAWAGDHLGWETSIAGYEALYQRLMECTA
jgi:polysaccharide biosynthesis protein PslH